MMNKTIVDALNKQVNAELWSANFYLSMSLDAEHKGYKGIANWFYIQYKEEICHARILMNYLNARDAKVELTAVKEVPTSWNSILAMFEDTLRHEQTVTESFQKIAALALKEGDFASVNRVTWFVDEQVEEEETAREMIQAFDSVEGNKYGLYQLDMELNNRQFTTPAPLNEK